jgi:tetratricopeptide (TPR) repeat protein
MATGRAKRLIVCSALALLVSGAGLAAQPQSGQQAVRASPAAEHFAAGLRLQQAGEYEQALEAYRAALRLEPKHVGAQANSGISYMALGKYEEAVVVLPEARAA